MARLVGAARQLIAQVEDLMPDAKIKVLDEVDGLGFQRSIRLDHATAKRVGAALDVIKDPRISKITRSSSGVKITFVADTRADFKQPYELAEVLAVLEAD